MRSAWSLTTERSLQPIWPMPKWCWETVENTIGYATTRQLQLMHLNCIPEMVVFLASNNLQTEALQVFLHRYLAPEIIRTLIQIMRLNSTGRANNVLWYRQNVIEVHRGARVKCQSVIMKVGIVPCNFWRSIILMPGRGSGYSSGHCCQPSYL